MESPPQPLNFYTEIINVGFIGNTDTGVKHFLDFAGYRLWTGDTPSGYAIGDRVKVTITKDDADALPR